jgi:3-phosphoglycerate kinase
MGMPLLEDLPDPEGANVLVRATLDLPLSSDPSSPLARIRAEGLAATVQWLAERGAHVTVWGVAGDAHGLGGSGGGRVPLSHVRSVLHALEPALDKDLLRLKSCVEDTGAVAQVVAHHDLFVNDTLQDSLLPVPSVTLPPSLLPSAIGRTLERDLAVLEPLTTAPPRPFVAVLGGERTFDRLHGLVGLVLRADAVLIGGGLALPMLQALGREPADDDGDFIQECRHVHGLSQRVRHRLVLPADLMWSSNTYAHISTRRERPGDAVVDIGPATCLRFGEELRGAGSVLWAGSVGRVESEPFRVGTRALAAALVDKESVVLGGDALVGLLWREGIRPRTSEVLTATDSAIELLKNGDLPAISAIREATRTRGTKKPDRGASRSRGAARRG